jgi:hypothetical protein
MDHVRAWWLDVANLAVFTTGLYPMNGPPGLCYRFTRTVKRSPILGIQAFPLVQTGYLQISGVQGGSNKMIARVCRDGQFTIDEFTIIEKHSLSSTYQQGQFVAFIPTEIYEDPDRMGIWLYINKAEIQSLALGQVPQTLIMKAILKL